MNGEKTRKDLTKIHELEDFEHLEDQELEDYFSGLHEGEETQTHELPLEPSLTPLPENEDDTIEEQELFSIEEVAPSPPLEEEQIPEFEDYQEEFFTAEPEEDILPSIEENLEEVKVFAENISTPQTVLEVDPPFSVSIAGFSTSVEKQDLKSIAKELDLWKEDLESGLERGAILFSRMTEYQAIELIQKIRHHSWKIHLAPSDLLHSPQSYAPHENRGSVGHPTNSFDHYALVGPRQLPWREIALWENHPPHLSLGKNYGLIRQEIIVDTQKTQIDYSELTKNPQILDQTFHQAQEEKLKKQASTLGANCLIHFKVGVFPLSALDHKVMIVHQGEAVWAIPRAPH